MHRTLAQQEVISAEALRIYKPDGSWRYALVHTAPVYDADGQLIMGVAAFNDVTPLKQAQDALRELQQALEQRVIARTSELSTTTAALRASEERFATAFRASPAAMAIVRLADGALLDINASFVRLFGLASERAAVGQTLIELGLLSATEQLRLDQLTAAGGGVLEESAAVLRTTQGVMRDMLVSVVTTEVRGEPCAIKMFVDITERTLNERLRRELQRQLLAAQEEEQRRIARELHDQFGQQLTALRLGLTVLGNQASAAVAPQVAKLQQLSAQLDADLDRMVLELRPGLLAELGLEAMLRQLVAHWTEQSGIPAELQVIGGDDAAILPEIATVLYRVAQEALTNIVKHAAARQVSIILEERAGRVRLIIEDDGKGFNPEAKTQPAGLGQLGLVGMQERIALVGGALTIELAPGQGTTIFVRVPLAKTAE